MFPNCRKVCTSLKSAAENEYVAFSQLISKLLHKALIKNSDIVRLVLDYRNTLVLGRFK